MKIARSESRSPSVRSTSSSSPSPSPSCPTEVLSPLRPTDLWTQRVPKILVACCCGFLSARDYGRFARLSRCHLAATRLAQAHPYRIDLGIHVYRATAAALSAPSDALRLQPRALRLQPWYATLADTFVPVPADWFARITELSADGTSDWSRSPWELLNDATRAAFVSLQKLTIRRTSDVAPLGGMPALIVPRYAALRTVRVRATVAAAFYAALPPTLERLSVMRVCTGHQLARAFKNVWNMRQRQNDAVARVTEHRKSRVALMNRPLPRLTHLRVPLDFGAADLRWIYRRAPHLESLHIRSLLRDSIAPEHCRANVVGGRSGASDGVILRTLRHFAYDSELLFGTWRTDENGYDALKSPHTTAPTPAIAEIVRAGGFETSDGDVELRSFRFGCRLRPSDVVMLRPMLQRLHTLCLANTTRAPSLRAMFGTRDAPNLPLLRKLSFRPSYRANGVRYAGVALDFGLVFALRSLEELDLRFCLIDAGDTEDDGGWRPEYLADGSCALVAESRPEASSETHAIGMAAAAATDVVGNPGRSAVPSGTSPTKPRDPPTLATLRKLDLRLRVPPRGQFGECLVPVGRMFPNLGELRVRCDHSGSYDHGLLLGYEIECCKSLDRVYIHSDQDAIVSGLWPDALVRRCVFVNDRRTELM